MLQTSVCRNKRILALASCLLFTAGFGPAARAGTIYAGNPTTNELQTIDTTTSTVSTLFTDTAAPRGLVFSGPSNIIYTTLTPGKLEDYSLTTHTSSVLATYNGLGGYVVLDPGGASVTFGAGGPGIERLNLSTHTVTTVSTFSDPRGLAYDSSGDLFAVLGASELARINPTTGAVLASITLPSTGSAGANGLAFDPSTGELFLTDDTNGTGRGLYEIPVNLSAATLVNSGLLANGLTSDGQGHLWIAELNHLDEYTIATQSLMSGVANSGMFDVALAPSSGPPPPPPSAPEPASVLLVGIGLAAAGALRKRISSRH
jgi:hypothetical protein